MNTFNFYFVAQQFLQSNTKSYEILTMCTMYNVFLSKIKELIHSPFRGQNTIYLIKIKKPRINGARHSWNLAIQWVPQLFECPELFHVNKSFKILCCGNRMHQVVQNMILSQGLQLKLSIWWRTTISGHHPFSERWAKVSEPQPQLKYIGSKVSYTFPHLQNKGCWPEIFVLHNRLSLDHKHRDNMIFWMVWCTLLPQYSIL